MWVNIENTYKTTAAEPFSLKIQQNDNTKLAFNVSFRNIQDHWKIINNFIIDNKFNKSEKIKIETPVLKGFNDDLRAIKGIDKQLQKLFDNRLKKIENPYKSFSNDNHKKSKIEI
jgi:CRISPR/Cas system CSM-associated protein Csm2 small subunit